jgi:SnoaL-like domain
MSTSTDVARATIGLAFVDAFNRRDADDLVAVCDPAIEWQPTVLVGSRRVYTGHLGLRRWIEDLASSAVQHHLKVSAVRILDGGRFAVFSEVATGDDATTSAAMLARLGESGLIVEAHSYLTDEKLLGQLGLLDG